MSLRVLTAATDTKLCALTDVKSRLGITAGTYDSLLTSLIVAASRAIGSYLGGRELARQRYEEKVSGLNRMRLMLSRWPVDPDSITVTVDGTALTDFLVERPQMLFYEGIWPSTSEETGQEGEENITVTYKAGYVLPNWIATWAAATAKTAGVWVRPTTPTLTPLLFECTTAGTTHAATEPTWPVAGATVTDNTAVWTGRDALELPDDLEEAALLLVSNWYQGGLDVGGNVTSERLGPMQVDYASGSDAFALPRAVQALLDPYR